MPNMAGPFCAVACYLWSAINRALNESVHSAETTHKAGEQSSQPQCFQRILQTRLHLHTNYLYNQIPPTCAPKSGARVQLGSDITLRKTAAALTRCSQPTSHWQSFASAETGSKRPQKPATNKQNVPHHAIHALKELNTVSEIQAPNTVCTGMCHQ